MPTPHDQKLATIDEMLKAFRKVKQMGDTLKRRAEEFEEEEES